MADVLSQSQIDALLNSMNSGGEPEAQTNDEKPVEKAAAEQEIKYAKYDFYSPRKFTKDKLKMLNSIFENYARVLTSQINGIFRVMTDTTVRELNERRYYEFVSGVGDTLVTLANTKLPTVRHNMAPLMVHISPTLALTLINHMLGGGDEIVSAGSDYVYSDVEKALYRRIVQYVINALGDGFSNYIDIDFEVERLEENLSMVQEVGLDETVIIVLLNVDVGGMASEKIKVCIPGSVLESIFQVIDNRKHLGRGQQYEDNRSVILDHLRSSKLDLTGRLATVQLDLNDIYQLRPGDVIDLNCSKDSEVKLFVERQAWYAGRMGAYKKNLAIQISRRLVPDEVEVEKEEEPEPVSAEQ